MRPLGARQVSDYWEDNGCASRTRERRWAAQEIAAQLEAQAVADEEDAPSIADLVYARIDAAFALGLFDFADEP